MNIFEVHPTLAKDTVEIIRLDVCCVRLMREATYPWVILVPARAGLRDLDDLNVADRGQVIMEMDRVAKSLKAVYQPHKINVAALGNVVEQLHIHIIARFQDDPAWPGPVWGATAPVDYDDATRTKTVTRLKRSLTHI